MWPVNHNPHRAVDCFSLLHATLVFPLSSKSQCPSPPPCHDMRLGVHTCRNTRFGHTSPSRDAPSRHGQLPQPSFSQRQHPILIAFSIHQPSQGIPLLNLRRWHGKMPLPAASLCLEGIHHRPHPSSIAHPPLWGMLGWGRDGDTPRFEEMGVWRWREEKKGNVGLICRYLFG